MENRIYYGEYSLHHWIDLMLKGNIILPKYQRHFVWNESKVETLINTLRTKGFVPPITIGAFKKLDVTNNLILDGQQRLTSILLAYLGRYPNEKTFRVTAIKLASENDDDEEPEEETIQILKWTFKELVKKGKNKDEILASVSVGDYKNIDLKVDDAFLKNTYLGFSYLVPDVANDVKVQQKYYSSVFRNINIQGETLLPQESRASLYYLDDKLEDFFDPSFFNLMKKEVSGESKADFVRYLSLLSQYKKDGNADSVARGYKSKMERYYEEYIYSVVGENTSSMFAKFETLFPNSQYKPRFERLEQAITSLKIPKQFTSIIDMDLYLFGLIYAVVIEGETINVSRKDALKKEITSKIDEIKRDDRHTRSPGALKYLKHRIAKSIEIYEKYSDD